MLTAISAGVAGSTILAGLLLLILWKLVTMVHDKREFEKFERERADTTWGRVSFHITNYLELLLLPSFLLPSFLTSLKSLHSFVKDFCLKTSSPNLVHL